MTPHGKALSGSAQDLRERARERLRERQPHGAGLRHGSYDVDTLVEELRVHQYELEIQNEELRSTQQALAESRDRYRELFDGAPVGYFALEGESIVELNRATCEILGDTHEHLLQTRFGDFVAPESLQRYRDLLAAARQAGQTQVGELALHNLRGDRWYVRMDTRGGSDSQELHCALVDISARKRAELEAEQANARTVERTAEIERNEEHLRTILETSPDGIVTVDTNGHIRHANPAAQLMFDLELDDMIGRAFQEMVAEPYAGEYERYFGKYRDQGGDTPGEIGDSAETVSRREIAARRHGDTFPAEVSAARSSHSQLFVIALRDLSRSKRLEHEVLEAAEQERARISRELHDSVSQQLAGLSMSARGLAQRLETEESPAAAEIGRFGTQLQEAARGLREVVHDLAPMELDQENLGCALKALISETERTSGLRCRAMACAGADLDTRTAVQLLRIAQECVHNALKHGEATSIVVRLDRLDGALRLTVGDNGKGIPAGHASQEEASLDGIGLRIMRYRASLVGAVLTIANRPGGGAAVTCTLAR